MNADKSFFARSELEYLGYWITKEGIQSVPKKLQAIQAIKEPKKQKATKNIHRNGQLLQRHVDQMIRHFSTSN